MIVQCFLSVFLFVLYYLPMCYSTPVPTATSGPFKTSVVNVSECRNPSKPYSKKSPIVFDIFIQNINGRNMFGGNLTVLKDTKDVKLKVKSYTCRDGKWLQTHSFPNLDCHGAMLHFTYAALKINYDRKYCMFLKGSYSFKNMDMNQLQHMWVPTMPYARVMWTSEAFTKDGMFFCKEFDTIIEPAK